MYKSFLSKFQMDLFFGEALHLLFALEMPSLSLKRRLQPLSEFLRGHLTKLKDILYPSCYRAVTVNFWNFVAKVCEICSVHVYYSPILPKMLIDKTNSV